jgi:hypothetical protein
MRPSAYGELVEEVPMSNVDLSCDSVPAGAGPSGRARGVRGGLILGGFLATLVGPGQSLADSAARTTVFTGKVVSATGHYASLRGSVRLVARSHAAASGTAFTLALTGPPCRPRSAPASTRCVSLAGRVTGTARAQPRRPADVGTQLALTGTGRVTPLGMVSVTGTAAGPGFIARGRPALTLSLRTSAGRLTITAQGPLVPGFTPPL